MNRVWYRIKRRLGLKIKLIDHLIYADPEGLSPTGRKMQQIFDEVIIDAFTKCTNEKTSAE